MFGATKIASALAKKAPATLNALGATAGSRSFHASSQLDRKVCVIGAAGGIGQPLSLLLKLSDAATELSLYDVAPFTPGVAVDLSHIPTPIEVTGFSGDDMGPALKDADLVIVPAGVPRKPGMTRDDLFRTNATIVAGIATAAAENCPNAVMCIISNPVNSTVPIVAEVFKAKGVYNKNKLFGVTTLDVCRANTFVSENQDMECDVKVIGGHAGKTILPLLSQVNNAKFSDEDKAALTHRIMFGGDEVVQAKNGAGSATLSMAFAGATFAERVLAAMEGEEDVIECAYVDSDIGPTPYFSSPIKLGPNGIEEVMPWGKLDAFEQEKFDEMVPELQESINKGVEFAAEYTKAN